MVIALAVMCLGACGDAAGPNLKSGIIAFSSDMSGDYEIYTMNTDGSDLTQLTQDSARDRDPGWSPDGSQIAFISNRNGVADVYIMNADGTGLQQLTDAAYASRPAWSPDGTKMVFAASYASGPYAIYTIEVNNTSAVTKLTNNTSADAMAAWSPDGQRIAYGSLPPGGVEDWSVWLMNADGSSQQRLMSLSGSEPAWSPDGARIAFTSTRDGNDNIYVMNADGTGQTRVTADGADEYEPTWAPDGSRLAFIADLNDGDDYPEIYVMNANGAGQHARVTNGSADYSRPVWRPEP
jgi:TolB protein